MKMATKVMLALGMGLFLPIALRAQLVQEFNPPRSSCCLPRLAAKLSSEMDDWNQLGHYHQENLPLEQGPPVEGRVVFMGDSITAGWDLAKSFPGKPYVNRGIGGQTTMQMVVRMYPDVIRLHPAAVIILAGTNDIARNTGPETLEMIQDNFRAMCQLAESNHIKIVLSLLTPVSDYTKSKQTDHRPPADIVSLNHWLESYARDVQAQMADYYTALLDDKGMLHEGYSEDGLHPNARGYELMAPIAEAAIARALK